MSDSFSARMIEAAKAYFVAVDNGRLPDELYERDFEFFFPKYGVGRGVDEFHAFGGGTAAGYKATHYCNRLKYMVSAQQLIVEGTTFGSDGHSGAWDGGKTPGGRFCSVFDFKRSGPDLANVYLSRPRLHDLDKERFHWLRAEPRW